MDATTVQHMLREDRDEWAALCAALDGHPEGPLHDPESPDWTARDVYNHLARWISHSTDDLEGRLAGRPVVVLEGTDDEINARWQRADSGLTLDEARKRAQEAFEHRAQAIEAVPADRWDAQLEGIARADGAEHFRSHRRYIVVA